MILKKGSDSAQSLIKKYMQKFKKKLMNIWSSHDFQTFKQDIQNNCFWSAHMQNWFGVVFYTPEHKYTYFMTPDTIKQHFYNSPLSFDQINSNW